VAPNHDSEKRRDQPGDQGEAQAEAGGAEQHPYVQRLRPDPSEPAPRSLTLSGVIGDSDRPGKRRLYFNRELDYSAEFRAEDVLDSEPIASDQPPFIGLQVTRVTLRRDAAIDFTRTRFSRVMDEFDLDVRLGGRPSAHPFVGATHTLEPCTVSCECDTLVDITCQCVTLQTDCDQNTCQGTCPTDCNQNTCQGTCQTRCGQNTCVTCQTCETECGQDTCDTCRTQCGQQTCDACTHATCFLTCDC
jgi:hypothetical protein